MYLQKIVLLLLSFTFAIGAGELGVETVEFAPERNPYINYGAPEEFHPYVMGYFSRGLDLDDKEIHPGDNRYFIASEHGPFNNQETGYCSFFIPQSERIIGGKIEFSLYGFGGSPVQVKLYDCDINPRLLQHVEVSYGLPLWDTPFDASEESQFQIEALERWNDLRSGQILGTFNGFVPEDKLIITLTPEGVERIRRTGRLTFGVVAEFANPEAHESLWLGIDNPLTIPPTHLIPKLTVNLAADPLKLLQLPSQKGLIGCLAGQQSRGSIIDNVQLEHIHDALDYSVSAVQAACKTCSNAPMAGSSLPMLSFSRYHRFRSMDMRASFGPGVFSNLDVQLRLHPGYAEFFDPARINEIRLWDDNGTGEFVDKIRRSAKHLKLYDALGARVATYAQAKTAVLSELTGETYTFELFRLDSSQSADYFGRVTRIADRNSNAIVVSYVDTNTDAADADLEFDRARLWRIASVADSFGLTATLNYARSAGQWVVSAILLPNATQITYQYNQNNLVGLNGITYPDGTTSQFSGEADPYSHSYAVTYNDAGATGTHRRKKAYFSNCIFSSLTELQPANCVRKVVNDLNEISYYNWNESDGDIKTIYVYEGGGDGSSGSLLKYISIDGLPDKVYRATQWSFSASPITYQWELVADYTASPEFHLTDDIDPLGRKTHYQRDPLTGTVLSETRFDAQEGIYATESSTYNQFNQPLVQTDRLGRVTKYAYDAAGKGNLENVTAAFGSPDEAVVSWTYNAKGQPLTYTDGNGNVTNYHYDDPRGFLTSIVEPADIANGVRAVYQYAYDAAGRLQSTIDPLGRTTVYGYDARNRLTSVTYHDSSLDRYIYGTVAGSADQNLLLRREDRNNNATVLTYDFTGRLTKSAVLVPMQGGGFEEQDVREISYLIGTEKPSEMTARGEKSTIVYDSRHRIVSTTVRPSATRTLTGTKHYDAFDRIDFETDPFNRRTFYIYDIEDRVVRMVRETVPNGVIDPAAVATLQRLQTNNPAYVVEDIAYDVESQVAKVTDARGVVSTKLYDDRGRTKLALTAAAQLDVNGVEVPITDLKVKAGTEYTYDDQNNLLQIKHPRSFDPADSGDFITKFTYTNRNLPKSRTEAFGRPEAATMSFDYALDGRVLNTTDGRNNVWSNIWKQCCGRLGATVSPTLEDGTRPITFFNYNYSGDLTHIVKLRDVASLPNCCSPDPTDADTYMEATTKYDARHRPVAQTVWFSALGQVDENNPPIYGDAGAPAGKTGLTTRWQYDDNLADDQGMDAPGGQYAALLADLSFGAGADGFAVLETNPESESTLLVYDSLGRLLRTIDPNLNATTLAYDNVVNDNGVDLVEASVRNALNFTRRSLTDGAGRTRKSFDEENFSSTYEFDAGGLLVRSRDASSNGVDSVFDARGRLTQSTDTASVPSVVKFFYDAHSNLIRTTDARDKDTVCVYDPRDRRKECTDRIAGITRFAYDANNNLLTITDADAVQSGSNKQTAYAYDERNLLKSETFPDDRTRSYTHDPMSRLATRLDQTGLTTTYAYDMASRLIRREYPDTLHDILLYDGAGRMTSAQSLRYGNTVTYTYDDAGRALTESLTVGAQTFNVGYGYDNANRQTSVTYPHGKIVGRTFTARNQLATVSYDGSNVASRTYDPAGRLLTSALGNNKTETRTYRTDNLIETIKVPGVTDFTLSWDANKRKTAEADAAIPQNNQTFGYDDEDRLTSFGRNSGQTQTWNLSKVGDWKVGTILDGVADDRQHNDVHEITTRNGQALTHDLKGNLTNDAAGHAYTWDVENRLATAVSAQHTSSYAYDAVGRRVSKTIDGLTTIYASAGAQEIAEYENAAAPETPTRVYTFGSYIDEPLMMISGGATYYYHANQQYSVAALTDGTGNVVERYTYDPYGKVTVLAADGTTTRAVSLYGNGLTFTGRRLDAETGLYYFRNRYYSSELGRFIGRDPLGYVDGMSLYAGYYVPNGVDPHGLYDWADFVNDATEIALTVQNVKWAAGAAISDAASSVYEGVPALITSSDARTEGVRAFRDNGIRQAYDREQEHLHDVIDLHDRAGNKSAATDTVAKMLSDVLGTTDMYEGAKGFDTTDYAKTGNATQLDDLERATRFLKGTGQVSGNLLMLDGFRNSLFPKSAASANQCPYRPRSQSQPYDDMLAPEIYESKGLALKPSVGNNSANRTNMGNRVHYDELNGARGRELPTATVNDFPETDFRFARRGASGPDVEVVGGKHPSQYPNSSWDPANNFGDFKPNTFRGAKAFEREINKGKLPPNTEPLPYDPQTGRKAW